MSKELFIYGGIPVKHEKRDDTILSFIVVYTTGNNDYIKLRFKEFENAMNFENAEAKLILRFISEDFPDNRNCILKYINYNKRNNILEFSTTTNFETSKSPLHNLDLQLHYTHFRIDFKYVLERVKDANSIFSTEVLINNVGFNYPKLQFKKGSGIYDVNGINKEYFTFFPTFEKIPISGADEPGFSPDYSLDILFLLYTAKSSITTPDKEKLDAYLMMAKKNYEELEVLNEEIVDEEICNEENDELDEISPEDVILLPSQFNLPQVNDYIGMEEIKLELEEVKALVKFRSQRIKYGLPLNPSTLHMIFKGNSGTGKTTIARLIAQYYFEIGLLKTNKLIEVDREGLVEGYLGHTAKKTKAVFDSAINGVLFIDEAYSLYRPDNDSDFGIEAITTLLKLMDDHRDKIVVIIAGYDKEIDILLTSNPGLKSRFSKTIQFRDFSKDELGKIFEKMVKDYEAHLTPGAKFKVEHIIEKYYDKGKFNSNARTIRTWFEETIKKQANRLSKIENPTKEEMSTIIDTDIPNKIP